MGSDVSQTLGAHSIIQKTAALRNSVQGSRPRTQIISEIMEQIQRLACARICDSRLSLTLEDCRAPLPISTPIIQREVAHASNAANAAMVDIDAASTILTVSQTIAYFAEQLAIGLALLSRHLTLICKTARPISIRQVELPILMIQILSGATYPSRCFV